LFELLSIDSSRYFISCWYRASKPFATFISGAEHDRLSLMVAVLRARLVAISWRDLATILGPIPLLSIVGIWVAIRFVRPAPPSSITITSGPDGSIFRNTAEKYRSILGRNGITLQILPSKGSLENLQRLNDPSFHVDVGFVQGGMANDIKVERLVSLGSLFYEPVAVFYRSANPIDRLSQFSG